MGKAQRDYTISDVIRLSPSWVEAKQTDVSKFNILKASIANMMDFGSNYIAEYKFVDVFPSQDISTLDIGDVNKALHEYKQLLEKKVEIRSRRVTISKAKVINNAIFNSHLKVEAVDLKASIAEDKRQILQHEGYIDDYIYEINRYWTKIHINQGNILERQEIAERKEAKLLEPTKRYSTKRLEILQQLPDNYMILETTAKTFTVLKTDPVHIKHTNAVAGVNKSVYLGYFAMTFDYDLKHIKTIPFADNVTIGSCHPHVGHYICWGSASSTATGMIATRNVKGMFGLLDVLFTTYGGNPFVRLASLVSGKNKQKRHVRIELIKKYPEAYQYIYQTTTNEEWKNSYREYFKYKKSKTKEQVAEERRRRRGYSNSYKSFTILPKTPQFRNGAH